MNTNNSRKTITIKTVQGVGDVFWVYQKLSPLFDVINLVICVVNLDCPVQKRVLPFLKLLPKVDKFKLKLVTREYYDNLAKQKKTMDIVLSEHASNIFPIEYAVNAWLEDGVRISEIDKYPLEETVAIKEKYINLPFKNYIILYISGNKISREWQPEKYSELINNTFKKYNVSYPIILIGAEYDEPHLKIAGNKLKQYGYEISFFIEKPFESVIYIIKNSKYFIGYQSGLSIIADNYDIPQTMLYFNFLGNVMYSWAKEKNIATKIYNAYKFEDNIECINNFNNI